MGQKWLIADHGEWSRSKIFLCWPFGLVLLICFSLNLNAQSVPTTQQLFETAHNLSDVTKLPAYRLTAFLVVTPLDKKGRPDPKRQQRGKLTILRDHDRARIEVQMGGESETQVQIGNFRYVDPSNGLLPALKLEGFDQTWDPQYSGTTDLHPRDGWGNPALAKVNGSDELCVPKLSGQAKDEFCFDPQSSALLRARGFRFFDYQKFGEFQFPQRVEITRPEMPPVEVSNIEITPEQMGADLFQVPQTMVPIESCEVWKFPKWMYAPEPDFTEAARKHKYQATVYINVIIGTDGKVLRARALNETRYGLSEVSAQRVATWKFEPATCGTRPVNSEMNIEVAFNLY